MSDKDLRDEIKELKSFVLGEIEALEAKMEPRLTEESSQDTSTSADKPCRKGGRYGLLARDEVRWSAKEDKVLLEMMELGIPQVAVARGLQRTSAAISGALKRIKRANPSAVERARSRYKEKHQ